MAIPFVTETKLRTRCCHAFSTGWACTCLLIPVFVFELMFIGINIWGFMMFLDYKKGAENVDKCSFKKLTEKEFEIHLVLLIVLGIFLILIFLMCCVQCGYYLSTLVPNCPTITGARQIFSAGGPILVCIVCVFIVLQLFIFGLITLIHYKESDYVKVHSTAAIFTSYKLVQHDGCMGTEKYRKEAKKIEKYLLIKSIFYNVFFYLFCLMEVIGILLLFVGPILFVIVMGLRANKQRKKRKKYSKLDEEID